MKKFLLIAVAAFGMLMTACSKDEVAQPVAEKSTVTFSVAAPELATRALGDGTTATQLSWAVYDKSNTLLFQSSGVTVMSGLKATVEIPFVNGMEYNILFWAEAEQSPYSVEWANLKVGYTNAAALVSNSEKYDAFYCYFTELGEVTGPVTKTVELKRPFAQLNIKTNDHDDAVKSGLNVDKVSVEISEGCDKFNLASGEGIKATAGTKITFGNATKVANDHLAVNYLFTGGEKSLVNVKFSYTDSDTKGGNASRSMEFAAVPVQRNYRTNIIGSLLTSEGNFNIETKPGFDGTHNPIDMLLDALQNGGEFTLLSDLTLTEPITIPAGKEAKINLGGNTLTVTASNRVEGSLEISNGIIDADVAGAGDLKSVFVARNGSTVSINDATVNVADKSAAIEISYNAEATVNISNTTMTIAGNGHGVSAPQGAKDIKINITDSKLTGRYALYLMQTTSVVTIDAESEVKDFWVMGGDVTVVYEGEKPEVKTDGLANTLTFVTKGAYEFAEVMQNGGNLTLESDLTLTDELVVPAGTEANIDLNGKTLTVESSNMVKGELNISNGTMAIDVEGSSDVELAFVADKGGVINIEDTTITVADGSAAVYVPYNYDATINIKDVVMTVEGNGHGVSAVEGAQDLKINITNSQLTGTYAIYLVNAKSVVTIDDASAVNDLLVDGGAMTVIYETVKPTVKTGNLYVDLKFYTKDGYAFADLFENGGNMTLEEDATLANNMEIAAGTEVSINLDGNDLNVASSNAVNGTLNISGGDVNIDIPTAGAAIEMAFIVDNGSTINVQDAEITVEPKNIAFAIFNEDYAYHNIETTINLTNVTLDATNGYGIECPFGAKKVEINLANTSITGSNGFHLADVQEVVITVDATSAVDQINVEGCTSVTVKYAGTKPNVIGNNVTFVAL